VVARGDERFALLVDDVQSVVGLSAGEIEAAPAMLGRGARGEGESGARGVEFIAGIGRPEDDPERLVILLDLDAVLSFGELRGRGAP
jgi:chemotaxis signal transduction protein